MAMGMRRITFTMIPLLALVAVVVEAFTSSISLNKGALAPFLIDGSIKLTVKALLTL